MNIKVKDKNTLIFDNFKFKCCIGKGGFTKSKKEGDKKTPIGTFKLGSIYFRKDKLKKLESKLKKVAIKKYMGWCDDANNSKYNKLIKINNKKIRHEKLFRSDSKYDLLIPIQYNSISPKRNKGSAIFLHLTKDYKKTLGCVAIKKEDMMILLKLITKKTKIKIF